jgi:hypothetical protein
MELTLADFVFFVIVGSFVLVPVFAIISRILHRREENRALANRVICRLCLRAFEDIGEPLYFSCLQLNFLLSLAQPPLAFFFSCPPS